MFLLQIFTSLLQVLWLPAVNCCFSHHLLHCLLRRLGVIVKHTSTRAFQGWWASPLQHLLCLAREIVWGTQRCFQHSGGPKNDLSVLCLICIKIKLSKNILHAIYIFLHEEKSLFFLVISDDNWAFFPISWNKHRNRLQVTKKDKPVHFKLQGKNLMQRKWKPIKSEQWWKTEASLLITLRDEPTGKSRQFLKYKMRFYRDAEWLTYFVPMPLLISGKCQAWKNSYLYNCERITCMYNTSGFWLGTERSKKGIRILLGHCSRSRPW